MSEVDLFAHLDAIRPEPLPNALALDLSDLRAKAEAAVASYPGKWVYGPYGQVWVGIGRDASGRWTEVSEEACKIVMSLHLQGDEPVGMFVEAAQPFAVMALVDRLIAAETSLMQMRAASL
jgi:hypothetical protein